MRPGWEGDDQRRRVTGRRPNPEQQRGEVGLTSSGGDRRQARQGVHQRPHRPDLADSRVASRYLSRAPSSSPDPSNWVACTFERHRERERAGQVARHCFGLGENRSGRPSSAQGQQPLPVGDAGMRRRPRVVRGRGQRGGFPERLHGRLAGTGEQLPRTEQQERIGQDRRVRGPCQGDRFRGGRGRAGQISGRVSQTAGDQLQVRPVRGRERCAAGVGADPAHPFQPLAGRTAQRPGQPCVG